MRRIKTIVSVVLIAIMFFTVGCSKDLGNGGINPGASRTLKIQVFDGDYGTDWLYRLAEAYCQIYSDVNIIIDKEVVMNSMLNNVIGTPEGKSSDYDILAMIAVPNKAALQGYIEPINDIFFEKIEGEDKSPAEKMYISSDYYNVEGNYYAFPWATGTTGLLVNETSIKKALGSKYSLPVTTNEFVEICEDIKKASNNVNSLIYSYGDGDYWIYIRDLWWAQYQGVAEYFEYFDGLYRNADGTPDSKNEIDAKFSDNAQIVNQKGMEVALNTMQKLIPNSKGYSHKSVGLSFYDAQLAFWGWGYGNDKSEIAFMPNGDWTSASMASFNDSKPQDISMMKVPVVSEIINVLPDNTIENDVVLASVIRAIDNNINYEDRDSSLSSVSENDWNRIKEARLAYMTNGPSHYMIVPSASGNKEDAKNFFKFFASDVGCEIYSQALNGGISPFNKTISKETAKTDKITLSKKNIMKNGIPIYTDYSSELVYLGGLSIFDYSNISGAINSGTSASSINQAIKEKMVANWATILKQAGLDNTGNKI